MIQEVFLLYQIFKDTVAQPSTIAASEDITERAHLVLFLVQCALCSIRRMSLLELDRIHILIQFFLCNSTHLEKCLLCLGVL